MTIRVVSFGCGVQSVAMLVLCATGRLDYKTFVFSNVGDDSEHPETMRYLREVAKPYAEAHGLELVEVCLWNKKRGEAETIHGRMTREGSHSVPIPMFWRPGGPPGGRACTQQFKIGPVAKYLAQLGATEENPARVALGISMDEIIRMRASRNPTQVLEYPLIDLGLSRSDCERIITEAGLPMPIKSSCYFCPFHTGMAWKELRDESPELFAKAVALEAHVNAQRLSRESDPEWVAKRTSKGKRVQRDPIYLTAAGMPLDMALAAWEENERLKALGMDLKSRLRRYRKTTGKRLPKGFEPIELWEAPITERHNCAPFACSVGSESGDPAA